MRPVLTVLETISRTVDNKKTRKEKKRRSRRANERAAHTTERGICLTRMIRVEKKDIYTYPRLYGAFLSPRRFRPNFFRTKGPLPVHPRLKAGLRVFYFYLSKRRAAFRLGEPTTRVIAWPPLRNIARSLKLRYSSPPSLRPRTRARYKPGELLEFPGRRRGVVPLWCPRPLLLPSSVFQLSLLHPLSLSLSFAFLCFCVCLFSFVMIMPHYRVSMLLYAWLSWWPTHVARRALGISR